MDGAHRHLAVASISLAGCFCASAVVQWPATRFFDVTTLDSVRALCSSLEKRKVRLLSRSFAKTYQIKARFWARSFKMELAAPF